MSQTTKNAKERKEKRDKDSERQTKQTHDAAPKHAVVKKESKETVDERELRRRLKEYESTVEQLLKHNSVLLKEKEEQQIEIQKLHEENTKLYRSNEEIQNIKAETDFPNKTKITDHTDSSDNIYKLNESGRDPGQAKVGKGDDERKEEGKRMLKAEVCNENLHKDASKEDKNKQTIEGVEVPVKELTDAKNTLLKRSFEVNKEEHEEEGGEERERILKAESCNKIIHQEPSIEWKYKQQIKELEARVKELTNENNQFSNSPSQDKTKEEERKPILIAECRVEYPHDQASKEGKYKRKIEQLEDRVKELKEEKNKLLNRLSEIGAMKMTDNNPNVTDLSDANRPEKLVEQFSELYDNEWTGAYLHLTKTEGKTIERSVKLLLQIVKEAYDICLYSATEKATILRTALLSYAGLSDQDSSEYELQEIEKKISEYRTKKSQCNVARVEEEVKHRFLNRSDHFETDISSTVTSYIGACVRICWFMCIKNPPMLLYFGETEESVASNVHKPVINFFDRSKFMPYKQSGDYIEYVVWPAVFLHEDGPIMKKGVAQGSHA
ncbi:hypothetical protein CHS0354_035502 [Potamilus streckersoni]|uniref:Mitochondria-eating protein n=1 Tax=Potamilus streckersoni TaxID=2493646 RepID=A0AAE0RVT9_9BIVA|nr:hypothetical protein CHS0354_035502 [Potamilus streckersoni]